MIRCAFRNGKAELESGELRFTPPHAPPLRWDLSDLLPFFEEVEEDFRIRNGFLILLQIPCIILLGFFLTGLLFRSNSETLPGVFVAVLLTLLPEIYLAGRMKRKNGPFIFGIFAERMFLHWKGEARRRKNSFFIHSGRSLCRRTALRLFWRRVRIRTLRIFFFFWGNCAGAEF